MDEPFSGLDPLIRRQMRLELVELQKGVHKTIVFITHDLDEAVTVGDRIAIMRDGEIIQMGTPQDIVMRPADDFVREFTLGVQKTKVLHAGSVASKPDVIVKDSDTVETLRSLMGGSDSAFAICVEDQGTFKGLIRRETVDEIKPSEKKPLRSYFDQSVEVISSDTILEDLLPTLIDSDHPVPVIDKENRCIGVATRRDVLRVIASESDD
jgi:glycine betaine/proline transport system ATP-binding protein